MHFLKKVNPNIDLEFYHIAVPIEEIVWPSDGVRRISVHSFGFRGTNTHVVLGDAYHYLQDATWSGIRIFSYRNKEWSECFWARMQVQHEEDALQEQVQHENRLLGGDVPTPV
jgi:acyl transferase domain-containing protein